MNKNSLYIASKKGYMKIIDSTFKVYRLIFKSYIFIKNKHVEKILIISNDHIGDTVIRVEYINRYIERFGYANVYFITSSVSDNVLKLISKNTIVYDGRKFFISLSYKIKLLHKLNSLGIKTVIGLVPYGKHQSMEIADIVLTQKENYLNEDNGKFQYVADGLTQQFNEIFNEARINEDFKPDLTKYILESDLVEYRLPSKYITLGMGADSYLRMYPPSDFGKVVNYLLKSNTTLVFLGRGQKDEYFITELSKYVDLTNSNIIILIGKTSLNESLNIIKNSSLFLGVESGLWNCAYSLKIPSIVIYGGGHWGRFMHQDESIEYVYNEMDCFKCDWNCKYAVGEKDSAKCISSIETNKIIGAIKRKGI